MDSRKLLQYTVRNDDGVDIPLSYLIRETQGEDFKRLYSGNGGDYYPVKITADDRTVESIVDFTERFVKADPRYSASFTGNYYSSREMIGELVLVLSVAVALLYFILAAQFESIVQPLVILSEIVIDVFWVFLVLWLLGESLNIMSMIGIVVMSGIIINDSILKVDTMNRLRRRDAPRYGYLARRAQSFAPHCHDFAHDYSGHSSFPEPGRYGICLAIPIVVDPDCRHGGRHVGQPVLHTVGVLPYI